MIEEFLKLNIQSRDEILNYGEEKAYDTFKRLRWSQTEGEPVCPKCGCLDHYDIPTRRKFKCAACHAQFSVTSGTMFASRKLGFVDLLAAMFIFCEMKRGASMAKMASELGIQYRTAYDLSKRMRANVYRDPPPLGILGESA